MRAAAILAIQLGTSLAFAVTATAFLLLFPTQARNLQWRLGLHPPVVSCTELMEDPPCSPASKGMLLTAGEGRRQFEEPLIEQELGRTGKTVFAKFSSPWPEKRSVFFVLREGVISANVRFDTDCGSYVGVVQHGGAHVDAAEHRLCFDLTIERMDGSASSERWQGRLDLE